MDKIESMKSGKAYVRYKLIVKNWENDFKTKFSRTPSKFDIKEAPSKIKYAYKKYFQLKSAALETSLSVCDTDEDEDFMISPEPVQNLKCISFESLSPQLEFSEPEQLLSIPSLPSGSGLEKLLSHAHKKQLQKDIKSENPVTDNLSKKLFQNSKFSLRNPRKVAKSELIINNNRIYDVDKENSHEKNVLHNESKDIDSSSSNNYENCTIAITKALAVENAIGKNSSLRQVNEAWLERASGLNVIKPDINKTTDNFVNNSEKFGMSNITIPSLTEKTSDYIENSESEAEDVTIDKYKPALKKRKINKNESISSREAHETEKETLILKRKTKIVKQVLNGSHNKLLEKELPPDIIEYLPFGLEENIVPRLIKPVDVSNIGISSKEIKSPKSFNENMDKLEKKISNGTLNENFVKINIEKKVFVRGRKKNNYSTYKKKQWKDKKALHASMEFPESGKIACFKCGIHGHMARYCNAHKGDTLMPLENYDENEIPTLENMQSIIAKEINNSSLPDQFGLSAYEPSPIPASFLKMLATKINNCAEVKPIYSDYSQDTTEELYDTLKKFGHKSFRQGQEEAIKRILCGMSTLLLLSTGGGKSLCYQLPAYIYSQYYKCITLVISPLVSLMEDQVLSMPAFLKAGCLHTNQSTTQRRKIIQCLKDGEINILLISPEALISGDGSSSFTGLFKSLPKIAFACIDEVHCVSQWSHNFRPSYLMICRVLREKLNVKCILGLTATASRTTIESVVEYINIPDRLDGVITNPTLPDNLHLSVSLEKDKDRALITFLNLERGKSFNSIIVYCIRRDECERVAALLRSCLQEPGKINMEQQSTKRKRMSYISEAYHAGMSAAQRKKIQKHFMDGTLRIIVATVAFGMGINKPDIRCIIHYNMPSSFESYVQEVGRAGRDGKPAYCHVFMNNSNNDKNELLKHIHANTIDRPTIRRLLQKVFISCQCSTQPEITSLNTTNRCNGHEVGIPIESTVEELDLPSENIATLLCYVELHPKQFIKVLNNAYTVCKISSYGGPQKIIEAAKNCPPLAMAYLLGIKENEMTKKSVIEFNVIEVAAAIGWESGVAKYHLKNLEWYSEGGITKRSHLKVEFNTLGFRIKAPGDLTSTELDTILDEIHNTVLSQEKTKLYQLEESNMAFKKYGNYSLEHCYLSDDILVEKSNELKLTIRNYFQRENNQPSNVILEERPIDVERVKSDVLALISLYKDCSFSGRSIARIFQGISSPNYPAIVWGKCKFWRSHIHEDFYGLIKIATQQIIQMKMI